jgi:phycocyanobilin lyase subunit beta
MISELENLSSELSIERLIQDVESASNGLDLIKSVQALADRRSLDAIPSLIKALGYNNPGAAIAAMYGLIAIGREAVPELLGLIDNYNYGARAYTVRALARIGDPRALTILLDCAVNDLAPSVRRAAIKGLGYLQMDILDGDSDRDRLEAQILVTLGSILKDTDWSMRYAAVVALDSLSDLGKSCGSLAAERIPKVIANLQAALEQEINLGKDLSVIARIQLALNKS